MKKCNEYNIIIKDGDGEEVIPCANIEYALFIARDIASYGYTKDELKIISKDGVHIEY